HPAYVTLRIPGNARPVQQRLGQRSLYEILCVLLAAAQRVRGTDQRVTTLPDERRELPIGVCVHATTSSPVQERPRRPPPCMGGAGDFVPGSRGVVRDRKP